MKEALIVIEGLSYRVYEGTRLGDQLMGGFGNNENYFIDTKEKFDYVSELAKEAAFNLECELMEAKA